MFCVSDCWQLNLKRGQHLNGGGYPPNQNPVLRWLLFLMDGFGLLKLLPVGFQLLGFGLGCF